LDRSRGLSAPTGSTFVLEQRNQVIRLHVASFARSIGQRLKPAMHVLITADSDIAHRSPPPHLNPSTFTH